MDPRLLIFPEEGLWLAKTEDTGVCEGPKALLKNADDELLIWTTIKKRNDCTQLRVCAAKSATRQQVVVSMGMILLQLADAARCCTN